MSLRRVGVLLGKEIVSGPKNFMFIFAVVVPIVITLLVTLLFGTLFAGTPKLGIADEGNSHIVQLAGGLDSVIVRWYDSAGALRKAVEAGAVDVGMALPAGFDSLIVQGQKAKLEVYIWGQSLARSRAIVGAAIAHLIREVAGQESPVEIVTTTLGSAQSIAWEDRLLPFVVLITVLIGGAMVPATSLVDEKQKQTLTALTTTPTSLEEVFLAKGLLGVILSLVMGVLTLVMNRAFGVQPLLLLLVLALSAAMAAAFGVLLGIYVKDINTLFATIKGIGILLYAPALIYMFPQIPQWIAKVFPTYYMIAPIVEIVQHGGGWPAIVFDVSVLVGLTLALVVVVALAARRAREYEYAM